MGSSSNKKGSSHYEEKVRRNWGGLVGKELGLLRTKLNFDEFRIRGATKEEGLLDDHTKY